MRDKLPSSNVWFRHLESSPVAIDFHDAWSCLESMVVDAAPAYQHEPAPDAELMDDAADEPSDINQAPLPVAGAPVHDMDNSWQQQLLVYIDDEPDDQNGAAPLAEGDEYRASNDGEGGEVDKTDSPSKTAASHARLRSMEQGLGCTTHGTAGMKKMASCCASASLISLLLTKLRA